ncbi:FAD-dependent oxidoreductase [Frankia sp. CNm7]|uniref:FAD-dependent oxidoreductase n=1 Tax=Frankia nepalensis TaxID=1836974 RepID=A0A937RUE5_9ACTN|nr:FAD-dependent oxidoreductase [Frankia nepalensis]MBL7497235.1 FAD-dependent oxidoreductase [Frankia nepalensis]MBL7512937.1 FAD-dependent oxidoreductase [Frankia nepalensis]MBL7524679.1 FAD-dependent oxidoreductase [Frankia nepalensis]MBL7633504.1 FAD-dependent oxidoreductase [Frankia nepalensis]
MTGPASTPATSATPAEPAARAGSRPAILTVDDDPSVSRAVARDLRRRFGEQCRIVRAESGQQALDALREMKLRGDHVAVLIADYRMPQLDGIQFLEQAMDLYPGAKRVLLTAYADTDAAINAINVVDLDHYLLKPWNPPEEKLYPVIDGLLDAWNRSEHRPVLETRVIGDRWSARSYDVREFLARNQVPYRWYLAEEPEGRRLLAAALANGAAPASDGASLASDGASAEAVGVGVLPVVVTPDGAALVNPTDAEIAAEVGLSTTPGQDFYDVIIIGGGPAGLGSAVYAASEGLRTVLIERTATGGQAGASSRIENYLGFPDGVSGSQLTDRARRQAVKFSAEVITAREIVELRADGGARTVRFADGGELSAHTVVLATGVSYRQLPAPGLEPLTGRGVFYGSALTEAAGCAGEDIYIVGGANSAGQAAVYLSRHARSVTMLIRGPSLTASMSHYLIQQIAAIPNITVRPCTEVIAGEGDDHLHSLILRDNAVGTTETVPASRLFVFIGAEPRTDWLDGVVERDAHGFVVAGPDLVVDGRRPRGWTLDRDPYHLETSLPGVFVAGDARSESVKRVASAVGEGAMAIALVHRFLA